MFSCYIFNMPKAILQKHRRQFRHRVRKDGKIIVGSSTSAMDVVIRDLSEGGARLAMPSTTNVPAEFDLAILSESHLYAARVRWRSFDELGVQFTGPARPLFASSLRDATKPIAETATRRQERAAELGPTVKAEFFAIHPVFRFGYEPNPMFSDRGCCLVELLLRNDGHIEAHQPFLCLPLLGLKAVAAPGWITQEVTAVRKMLRFARADILTLAPGDEVNCCSIRLALNLGNKGVLEYEVGSNHSITDLPNLQLTCVAGAGNYPSGRIALIVPAKDIFGYLVHLAEAGAIPSLELAVEDGQTSTMRKHAQP
jgi:hypothetical protein